MKRPHSALRQRVSSGMLAVPAYSLIKKILLTTFLCLLAFNLLSVRNWQIHTNTTHIFDMMEIDNKIYQATWGGMEVYDIRTDSFVKTYSIFDGLIDQNIRSLSYLETSGNILLGTSKGGINRLKGDRFLMPISEVIGLPEGRVDMMVSSDSLIYAVTGDVLAVFVDSPGFPFPLSVNHHSTHNGIASRTITALELSDNYLFVGTDRGLNIVQKNSMNDPSAWNLLTTENSFLPGNHISSVSVRGDMIAVGTREGLVRSRFMNNPDNYLPPDFSEGRTFRVGDSAIDSNIIHNVFIDSDYNIWLSHGIWNEENLIIEETRNVVITRITPQDSFYGWYIDDGTGLFSDQIMGFREINEQIYAYTWGEGFFFLHNDIWINRQPNTLAANNITDISIDNNGVVWICNGFIGPDYQLRANPGVSGFDGYEWTTFRARNSPLVHDKVFRITTDAKNRKWFGTWNHGVSVFDEDNDRWYLYDRSKGLPANTIGALTTDDEDNIWISSFSGGMVVLEIDAIEQANIVPLSSFHLYDPTYYSDVIDILITEERSFFGSFYSGLRMWDAEGIPESYPAGQHWSKPAARDLIDGFVYIYGIDIRDTHWGQEIWIASERGYLFMYDTSNSRWYRYGTGIKREVWLNNSWQIDRRYFVDEERLFGAAPTFPTAVLVDPFDRIWFGTESNGITLYDLSTDRFSVYNTDNSPLLSNTITSLAYEPFSGKLYIGTTDGLNSVEIGRTEKRDDFPLKSTTVLPNPFYPERDNTLRIFNSHAENILPKGENKCHIYNVNGELIITLEENSFSEFAWDGNNRHGNKCGSGIYFYVVSSPQGQTDRGTIVLVR